MKILTLILIIALLGIAKLATAQTKTCSLEGNFDYMGNDLNIMGIEINSIGECCNLCTKTDGCNAWTFLKYDNWTFGKCYMKTAAGEKVYNTRIGREIYSGIVTIN